MNRRSLLMSAGASLVWPVLARRALADDRLFYTPGLAEAAMDAGQIVLLDFWTNWCPTCAAQDRVIEGLRQASADYDRKITFITVDWDKFSDGKLAADLKVTGRSTLVALKGHTEIGRLQWDTTTPAIKALMDAALAAAAV